MTKKIPENIRNALDFGEMECIPDEWLKAGYHWCPDWDFLLVGPDNPEARCCFCNVVISSPKTP